MKSIIYEVTRTQLHGHHAFRVTRNAVSVVMQTPLMNWDASLEERALKAIARFSDDDPKRIIFKVQQPILPTPHEKS